MKKVLLLLFVVLFILPSNKSLAAEVSNEKLKELDRFIEEQRKENGLAGVAYAIVSQEEVIYSRAFGSANLTESMETTTPVIIGSTSKAFTALSVIQLVENGAISLDESIATYLPAFAGTEKEKITIRNLLHHTSGLPTMAGLVLVANSKDKFLYDTIELVKDVELAHEVGEEFEYSNINYILLSAIVEYTSGIPYAEYVSRNILSPLQLENTYVHLKDAKNVSPGHAPWFGFSLPTKVPYYENAIASGYMISSAEDMALFLKAHMMENSIISGDMIKHLHAGVAPIGFMENASYGMGWFERDLFGQKLIGHGGDIPSTGSSDMYYLPEQNVGVVVVSNTHNGQFVPGNVHEITEGIIAHLLNETPIKEEGMSFSKYYTFFNIIVGLVLVLTLGSFYFLIKRKISTNKILLSLSILIQIIIPISFYLSVPLLLKAPWEAAFILQPDLITCLFIFFTLLFIRGIWLSVLVFVQKKSESVLKI
ncbi:beta-lactamase family protein [Bacillus luteolus]|uniref:Beta-lactamase family protein n=1 Tax=Litchfieldia luteola TaxID=682179 RepID=A0ABR9QGN2_9BACI|nr:serine hydrolase domain-containing protein [Cytobacillus luteolus]MBE4907641.1 beta-lactamase family protein [Cytobacillus luteolus]MBP1941092.1 CubicO group peptidase (beta-lactamase class C family) [Cytobacillus luteolus]